MALKLRPKRFGPVFIRFDGTGAVTFATQADGPDLPYPPSDTPVLTLLASVGHCLVESIRIIAKRDDIAVAPFATSVMAEKAIDAPGRLQAIQCTVHGQVSMDPKRQHGLISEAKSVCTVSNSLNSKVTVENEPA